MNTLKIQNTSGITENIKFKIINKLHDVLKNITLTNSHNLQGRLDVTRAHRTPVTFLTQNFNNLYINVTDEYYVEFIDNNVKKMMVELYGDTNNEVVVSNVTITSLSDIFSKSNMQTFFGYLDGDWEIVSFDELPQFTTINKLNTSAFANQSNLTSVNLSNITQLGSTNFIECTSLTNLGDTSNITTISGEQNFKSCTSLTTIELSPNLKVIPNETFRYCTNLSSIDLTHVESIGIAAFHSSAISGELSLPNLTYIGGEAFAECQGITNITNLGTITTLNEVGYGGTGYGPFRNCEGLISCTLPSTLTLMKRYSFASCTALTTIIGGHNVEQIQDYAFYGCINLENVGFNFEIITSLGTGAFQNCENLNIESLNLASLTGRLQGYTFMNCKKLKYILSLGNCTSFGSQYNASVDWGPFANCTSLISVQLPSTLSIIDRGAFRGCTSLTTINFDYITNIYSGAFYNCTSLTSIDLCGCISIGNSSFYGCTSLTTVISPSLITIDNNAFYNCTSLSNINTLNVETVGNSSFNNAGVNNVKLIFPNIISIGKAAFGRCKFIYLEFGENLTTIKDEPFFDSNNLKTLVFRSLVPPTYTDSYNRNFLHDMTNLTIYVPDTSINDYKTASLWINMADHIKGISELPIT